MTCCPVSGQWLPCPLRGSEQGGDQVPVTVPSRTSPEGWGRAIPGAPLWATQWGRSTAFTVAIPPARPRGHAASTARMEKPWALEAAAGAPSPARHLGGGQGWDGRSPLVFVPPGLPDSAPLDFCFLSCSGPTQINQVVSHPSQPLTITAHDDRGIRFLDNRTGEAQPPQPPLTCAVGGRGQSSSEREIGQSTFSLSVPASPYTFPGWAQSGKVTCCPPCLPAGKSVHSMVAHLDAVTCLAVDPNGVFLMSGSKSGASWPLRSEGTCPSQQERERSARGAP